MTLIPPAVDPADPDVRVLSAASGAYRAHRPDSAESYCYRRTDEGPWERISGGLPTGEGVLRAVLDSGGAGEFYAVHKERPFFGELVDFMTSAPCVVMVLEGENVIAGVRDLLGPTDSTKAAKGTIRGDMGIDKSTNVAHASDGPETAAEEIARFFSPAEVH